MSRRATIILAAIAAGTIAPPAQAAPTDSRILIETYGNCADVSLKRTGKAAVKMLQHACHGWSVEDCGSQMFFRRHGVQKDDGKVAWRNGRSIDVVVGIDAELSRAGDEPLHLSFRQPVCTASGFELPFSGSRIGSGETGSASKLEGKATVSNGGAVLVTLSR